MTAESSIEPISTIGNNKNNKNNTNRGNMNDDHLLSMIATDSTSSLNASTEKSTEQACSTYEIHESYVDEQEDPRQMQRQDDHQEEIENLMLTEAKVSRSGRMIKKPQLYEPFAKAKKAIPLSRSTPSSLTEASASVNDDQVQTSSFGKTAVISSNAGSSAPGSNLNLRKRRGSKKNFEFSVRVATDEDDDQIDNNYNSDKNNNDEIENTSSSMKKRRKRRRSTLSTADDHQQPISSKNNIINTSVIINSNNSSAKIALTFDEYLAKQIPSEIRNVTVFCTLCVGSNDIEGNHIILCDNCDASFHQNCHQPNIEDFYCSNLNVSWFCFNCLESEKALKGQPRIKQALEEYKKAQEENDDNLVDDEHSTNQTDQQEIAIQESLNKLSKQLPSPKQQKENEDTREPSDDTNTDIEQGHREDASADTSSPSTPLETLIPTDGDETSLLAAMKCKRKPGRPRKQIVNDDMTAREKVRLEKAVDYRDSLKQTRCIACGIVGTQWEKDDQQETSTLPEEPIQLLQLLLRKTCSDCNETFSKHFGKLKSQPSDLLALLLTQTALRYNHLEQFLTTQKQKETPFVPQQLMAYSAKSRYLPAPSLAVLRVIQGNEAPIVNEMEMRYHKRKSTKLTKSNIQEAPATEKRAPSAITTTTSSSQDAGEQAIIPTTPNSPIHENPYGFEFRRRPPTAYGSYEDMIARAILTIGNSRGSKPKEVFAWMEHNVPGLQENFRGSATQALKKGCDRGRFIKVESGWYRMNPTFEEPSNKKRRFIIPVDVDFHKFAQTPHNVNMLQHHASAMSGTPALSGAGTPVHGGMVTAMSTPGTISTGCPTTTTSSVSATPIAATTTATTPTISSDAVNQDTATAAANEAFFQAARRQSQEASAAVAAAASLPQFNYATSQHHAHSLQTGPVHNTAFQHPHMMMAMPHYNHHAAFFHHQAAAAAAGFATHPHSFHAHNQAMQAAAAAVAAAASGQDQNNSLDNVLGQFQNGNGESVLSFGS